MNWKIVRLERNAASIYCLLGISICEELLFPYGVKAIPTFPSDSMHSSIREVGYESCTLTALILSYATKRLDQTFHFATENYWWFQFSLTWLDGFQVRHLAISYCSIMQVLDPDVKGQCGLAANLAMIHQFYACWAFLTRLKSWFHTFSNFNKILMRSRPYSEKWSDTFTSFNQSMLNENLKPSPSCDSCICSFFPSFGFTAWRGHPFGRIQIPSIQLPSVCRASQLYTPTLSSPLRSCPWSPS